MAFRSISSSLMTDLIVWRNPQGSENNWIHNERSYRLLPSINKCLASEVGFGTLAVLASIETAVRVPLSLLLVPCLAIIDPQRITIAKEELCSSAFTAVWATANLFFNFTAPNLLSEESLARGYAMRGGGILD